MDKEKIIVTVIVLVLSQLSMMAINLVWYLAQKIRGKKK